MKANELMIGDWVDTPQGVRIVTIIGSDKVAALHCGFSHWVPIDELSPIPLTPEILEKNGFEKRTIGRIPQYVIADDYFDIMINEYTDSIWRFEYNNAEIQFPSTRIFICYVHELQHALRLCGIDKEIVL